MSIRLPSRRRSTRSATLSVWTLLIPGFVGLCMVLGGSSSGGLLANSFLEFLAALLLGYSIMRLGAVPLSRSARILLTLVACWVGWCLLQLVPLPPTIWTLAPGRELLEQRLRVAAVPLPWLPLSLSPEGTVRHLLALLPPLAVGAMILTRPPKDAAGLSWVIPLVALGSLFLGVLQLRGGHDSHLYLYQVTNLSMAVGLMANANHQATLMLCAIPFVASLASGESSRSKQARGREVLVIAVAGMLVIGVAISNCYAAYILTPPVLIASWLVARPRSLGPARYIVIGMAVACIAAVAIVLIAGPDVLDRDVATGESQLSRPAMYAVALKAMLHFLPFGSGPGSFVPTFKLFEDPAMVTDVFVNHSHSDYLEFFLEGGVPGIVLVVGLLLWWCRQAATIWFDRSPRRLDRAAVVATAVILAHSAIDYPVRTSTIAVILGAGLALMATRMATQDDDAPVGGRHLTAE